MRTYGNTLRLIVVFADVDSVGQKARAKRKMVEVSVVDQREMSLPIFWRGHPAGGGRVRAPRIVLHVHATFACCGLRA